MSLRLDIAPLNRIFSGVTNALTGQGTARDQSAQWDLAPVGRLGSDYLAEVAFNGGFFDSLINWLPDSCAADWLEIELGEADEISGEDIENYLEEVNKEAFNCFGVREAFQEASRLARQDKNAYILLGIADGRAPSEPVDLTAIASVEWLRVCSRQELHPQEYYRAIKEPTYYRAWGYDRKEGESAISGVWHKSRVLRFSGVRLSGEALWRNNGEDLSAIEPALEAWAQWRQANGASAVMLSNYSMGVLKMQGLQDGLERDLQNETTTFQSYVQQRLSAFARFLSNLRVGLIDKEKEEFGFVQRNYAGVPEIVRTLKDDLIAACPDTPAHILFNSSQGGDGLSTANTAGQSERFKESAYKTNWVQKHWVAPYTKLVDYAMHAKNSPTSGTPPDSWSIKSCSAPLYTEPERVDMMMADADTKSTLVAMGAIAPEEVRQQYSRSRWSPDIALIEGIELEEEPEEAIGSVRNWDRADAKAIYVPPKAAQRNAQKVLDWKRKHPRSLRGMTSVGWRRARQLASGKPISLEIVKRMASFNRHRRNSVLKPEYRGQPWKQAGYVAWLGWGGDAGIRWALNVSAREDAADLTPEQASYYADALEIEPSRWTGDGLPDAIIVDMDGTLALMGDRDPLDFEGCGRDAPNRPVLETVLRWQKNTQIIVITGRENRGTVRQQTEDWLQRYGVRWESLHLREAGDCRDDTIVKKEIYDRIKNACNILFVLEDRDRVVKMWRDLGLAVFQVAEGDF